MSTNIDQWLYSEVLPELRKTGVYSCRITKDQQDQIKQAIKAYSEKNKIEENKVRENIYKKFIVNKISDIRVLQFKPVMKYLDVAPKKVKQLYI